jgi:hypothetical protein
LLSASGEEFPMSKTIRNQTLNDQLRSLADNTEPTMSMKSETPSLADEAIRERAYERYLQRGGSDGYAEGDWYEAEQELKASGRD